jgi:ElaB/YqjD/DUF883 family membrane-anchored ribosome-binding protein
MSTSNFPQSQSQGKSEAGKAMNTVKDKAGEVMQNAGQAVEQAKTAAQQGATRAGEFAQQTASAVADRSREAMQQAGTQADRAAAAVGTQVASAADGLRSRLPDNGILKDAGERVASAIETGGHYLEEHKLSGSMEDLTGLVKKYPLQALAIGVGIGFVFARIFTSDRNA